MSSLIPSLLSASRSALRSCPRALPAGSRSVASTSKSSAAVEASTVAPAVSSPEASPDLKLPPSSCPAGTPLPGLAILKDRPEPIALPDADYPPWLWGLLATPAFKTTSASTEAGDAGAASASATGQRSGAPLTKGQLRVQQKREFKERRAAVAAAARAERTAKERRQRMGLVDSDADVPVGTKGPEAEEARIEQDEMERKMALRKANRQAIKARNFVQAS